MAASPTAARLADAHPTYSALAPDWQLYRASYSGGTTYTRGGYLFQHHREDQKAFTDREARAVYPNYSRKVVDIYNAFLFKDHATRTTEDQDLQDFLQDVDRRGTSMGQLMSEHVEKLASIYGHVVFLVDLPRTPTDLTLYEEQAARIRPYVTVYTPLEVLDWATDEDGAYTAIRFLEYAPPEANLFVKRTDLVKRYRTWTTTEWFLHDADGTLLDTATHDLGIVPAFRMDFRPNIDGQPIGESLLADIAPLNRAIFNYRSLLDEFLYLQCVTGDTLIDCPRDLEQYPYGVPIKELVGKEFLTYTWDVEHREYTLRKAFDVRKTGTNREVWRLTYTYRDEYNQPQTGHVDATPDHRILIQTGEWKQLKDLQPGDKLVPMYRWVEGHTGENRRPHILQTLSPSSGISEHRFIVRERGDDLLPEHDVHHIDERSLNNSPENLAQIPKAAHRKLTAAANAKRKKAWWANATDAEKRHVTERALAGIAKWRENPEAVREAYVRQSASIKKTLKRLTTEERKAKVVPALEARGIDMQADVNHEVVSVHLKGYEDVYNMEVEGHHNFVANGIVVHNCFNILGIPVSQAMTADQVMETLNQFGTTRGLTYDGTGGAPSFIAPSPEPAKILLDAMLTAAREITSIAKLQDRAGSEAAKSGIAWAYEFHEANAMFAKIAKTLEAAEQRIVEFYYRWKGVLPGEADPVTIQYPTDFNVRTLREEIDETLGLLTLRVSDRFNKELRKGIVARRFPALDPETQEQITEEIEQAPPDDVLDREAAMRLGQEQPVPGQPTMPMDTEETSETEDAPEPPHPDQPTEPVTS